ncbi:MAG: hypothetical protein ACFFCV_11390 [Promethearchaeota archaeon]
MTDLKQNSDNTDSWVTFINLENRIYSPRMKWVNGSIYIAGEIYSSYNYDETIYLTKFHNNGTKLWEKNWDTPEKDRLCGFEIDSLENVYLLCTKDVSWPYDQPESILLLKYSCSGELFWAKTINTSRSCYAYTLKLDQSDFVYIAGVVRNNSVDYYFLQKLNNSGDIIWNNRIESNVEQLELDSQNNIYIYGVDSNYFPTLYKYNSTGSKLWSINLEQSNDVSSMKIDSNNDILLTGKKYYYYNDSHIMWISKYNNSGILTNKLEFISIEYDWDRRGKTWFINNDIYIFIDYPLSPNYCLLKYNNTFQLDWNATLNEYYARSSYYGWGFTVVDVDSHDNMTFCYSNTRIEYYRKTGINSRKTLDVAILKLESSGEIFSHYYWGGSYQDSPMQIFIDPADDVYLLCYCDYVNKWNKEESHLMLIKNPEINGKPPGLEYIFGFYDYYVFSFLGFMSLISIILLISIIKPKLRRIRKIRSSHITR